MATGLHGILLYGRCMRKAEQALIRVLDAPGLRKQGHDDRP